jgi:regulation of enolase protein 1 (concanavalin A-like superfamily)
MQYGVAGVGTAADGFATELSRDVKGGGYLYGVYDKRWRKWPFKAKPDHVYLRLERKAELLLYQISPDQKEWVTIGGGTILGLPHEIKVGLGAYTTSTEPSKVCFDQLRLTRGKKKER